MTASLVVVALGGNALLRRGEPPEPRRELERARAAAESLAPIASTTRLVITHGNGPQVGVLAAQQRDVPLDVVGAQTEGAIGHELTLGLRDALPGREIATLVTQTLVDAADPAFDHPTKPIGAMLDPDAARELRRKYGWTIARDGDGWRRVVPSPEPLGVLEHQVVRLLADAGVVVVCAGGGGIPVVRDGTRHRGVEAVVDKDLASARLAIDLGAQALVLLTDVAAVHARWGTPETHPLSVIDRASAAGLGLAAGSMGPKVEAGLRFAEATGGLAAIGALDDAAGVLAGRAGTRCTAVAPSTTRGGGPCEGS